MYSYKLCNKLLLGYLSQKYKDLLEHVYLKQEKKLTKHLFYVTYVPN